MHRRPLTALLALAAAGWLAQAAGAAPAGQAKPAAPLTDLDAFMARVLERRNENWKTLHDYILSERETFQILGPAASRSQASAASSTGSSATATSSAAP